MSAFTLEEAELIAQFGFTTAFDASLLGVDARMDPSAHRGHYGDTSLFLTGTSALNEGEMEQRDDHRGDHFLENTSAPLQWATLAGAPAAVRCTAWASALRAAERDLLGSADATAHGAHSRTGGLEECEDEDIVATLDALLAEARGEVSDRSYHYQPSGEEGEPYRRWLLGCDEALTAPETVQVPTGEEDGGCITVTIHRAASPDPFGADDDVATPEDDSGALSAQECAAIEAAVDARIAQQRAARESALTSFPRLFEDEPDADVTARIEAAQLDADLLRRREAYGEIRVEGARRLGAEVDAMAQLAPLLRAAPAGPKALPLMVPGPTLREAIAEGVAAAEGAEGDESESEPSVPRALAPPPPRPSIVSLEPSPFAPTISEQRSTMCAAERLLPMPAPAPNATNTMSVTPHVAQARVPSDGEPIVAAVVVPQLATAAQRRRHRERAAWLRARESEERVRMRAEEQLAEEAARRVEVAALRGRRAMATEEVREGEGRAAVEGEQALAFVELLRREGRQRVIVLDVLRFQATRAHGRAIDNIAAEEGLLRLPIADEQANAFHELTWAANTHRAAVAKFLAARAAIVAAAERATQDHVRDEADAREDLLRLHARAEAQDAIRRAEAAAAHRRMMLEQRDAARAVRRQRVSALTAVPPLSRITAGAVEALQQHIEAALHQHAQSRRARPEGCARPTTPTPPPPGSAALDANAFHRVHGPLFGLAKGSADVAAVAFRSLSFSLEGLTAIDYDSCAAASVAVQPLVMSQPLTRPASQPTTSANDVRRSSSFRGGGERRMAIGPLVAQLDLSSNALSSVHLARLLTSTMPSLAALNLARNQLVSLDDGGQEGDAIISDAATAMAAPLLLALDASDNRIPSDRALCGALALPSLVQLVLSGNQLESLPADLAARCPSLMVLELARNQLTSIAPLAGLHLLETVNVSANCLTDLAPLQEQLLLTALYASENALSELPHMHQWVSLRTLFVAGNRLEHLDAVAGCPFLTHLAAGDNLLVSIEGVRGCPLLEVLDVGFNHLEGAEDVVALAACPLVQRLSINDNPCTAPDQANLLAGLLRALCPHLRELNATAVDPSNAAPPQNSRAPLHGMLSAAASDPKSSDLRLALCRTTETARFADTAVVHREEAVRRARALQAFAQDYEALSLHQRRRLGRSASWEQRLQAVLRGAAGDAGGESARYAARHVHLLRGADHAAVAARNGFSAAITLHRHLSLLLQGRPLTDVQHWPRVAALPRNIAAVSAVAIITRFLSRCVAVRRAREAAAALRLSSVRHNRAATRIQAHFRGHRVRRQLRGTTWMDDDDEFRHVDIDSEPVFRPSPSGVPTALAQALAAHGAAPVLHVQQARAPAATAPRVGSAPTHMQSSGVPPSLQGGFVAPRAGFDGRPHSQQAGPQHLPSPPRAPPGDEWSAAMQSHMRNKNMKIQKQQHNARMKEMISDPLKTRQRK